MVHKDNISNEDGLSVLAIGGEYVEVVEKINSLLKSKELNIPDYRRYVTPGRANVSWLRKKLKKRNSSPIVDQILELLEKHPANGRQVE